MIPQRRSSRTPRERIVTNCLLYQNVGELQHVIKQSAKERLLLERQVAQLHRTVRAQKERSEQELRVRLHDVEERLREQESQLAQLQKDLDDRCEISADLERQLLEALEQKIEVEAQNATLEERIARLNAESSSERRRLSAEARARSAQCSALEALVSHLRQAADQRRLLERQHAQALEEVRAARQAASVHKADAACLDTIQGLESKVRELQKKCELQNVLHEELVLEMASLRRQQTQQRNRGARDAWRAGRSFSAEVTSSSDQTCSLELSDQLMLDAETSRSSHGRCGARSASPPLLLDDTGLGDHVGTGPSLTCSSVLTVYFESDPSSISFPSESTKRSTELSLSRTTTATTTREVDRILARIQQDNRVLAELERSRATIGSPVSVANLERVRQSIEAGDSQGQVVSHEPLTPSVASMLLQSQLSSSCAGYHTRMCSTTSLSTSLTGSHHGALAPVAASRSSLGVSAGGRGSLGGLTLPTLPAVSEPPNGVLGAVSPGLARMHQAATPTVRQDSHGMLMAPMSAPGSQQHQLQQQQQQQQQQHQPGSEEDSLGVESVEFVDLPGRGRCRVYVARYSYDPLKQSPNEHPEAELYLNAGDYILIFGDMDEDGFFNGELMDGRKGLVPSNFVLKLTGEDLFEFQTTILYGNRDSDDSSASFSYAPDLDALVGADEQHRLPPEDLHRMNDYIDLEDIEEVDEDALSETERENDGMGLVGGGGGGGSFPVPPPQRLVMERQLIKSVLIGWLPPDVVLGSLEAYHVYVDGVLKATVRAGHRTRALLEGVDSAQPHRISVRSVLTSGQHSRDAACTIVIGKNVPLAPSCVKASNVTSTAAAISWLPSNSNFSHVVAVNSVEMKCLKPGCFRHLVSGLAPNTSYRVSVRAKPGRLLLCGFPDDSKAETRRVAGMLTAFVDFRTLPKGIPDPPMDIQVEAGPQEGTVLVTWLPVTINAAGTSNGAPVTGYAVYAAGRKITEIDSPTGDHALLEVGPLLPLHTRSVTVRTKAGDTLSADSLPCLVPDDLVHGTRTPKSVDRVEENHSELSDIVEELEDEMLENGELGHRGSRGSRGGSGMSPRKHHHHHHHHHQHTGQQSQQQPQQMQHGQPVAMHQQPPQVQGSQMHVHGSGRREKRNSAGQLIIEPDDALSDKEIYPYYRGPSIPSVGMTKDMEGGCGIGENYSEEEFSKYDMGPRGAPRGTRGHGAVSTGSVRYHQQQHQQQQQQQQHQQQQQQHHHHQQPQQHGGAPMSYQERPRPTSPTPPTRSRHLSDVDDPRGSYSRSTESRSGQRQPRVRWFVALFDYDPQTMSPNPDTADEELPFQEGDLIKIYGGKDQDGFYKGEANGRMGFVPCNMVSEVHMDSDVAETGPPARSRPPPHRGADGDAWAAGGVLPPQPKRMVALYDYDPAELSPNPDPFSELAFSTGDVIYVYGDMDEDGFFFGELHGLRGLVPSNFLTEAPPDYAEGQRRTPHGAPMQAKATLATNRPRRSSAPVTSSANPCWPREAAGPAATSRSSTSRRTSRAITSSRAASTAAGAPTGDTRAPGFRTRARRPAGTLRPTTRSSGSSSILHSTRSSSSSTSSIPTLSSIEAAADRRPWRPTTSTGGDRTTSGATRDDPSSAHPSAGEEHPVPQPPPGKKGRFRILNALKRLFRIKGRKKKKKLLLEGAS